MSWKLEAPRNHSWRKYTLNLRAKYCLNKRTWNFSKKSYDLGTDLYLREVVTNNNYFCGFLKFQNQWTCTAQWAKNGLSQKMTKQIKLRYCYDFEMFTKWNHTTILKIWIRYFLNNRGNQLQSLFRPITMGLKGCIRAG